MRIVLQRVSQASIVINGKAGGQIGQGYVALVGFAPTDTPKDFSALIEKMLNLRLFENEAGKFDKSLLDIAGDLLIVSQFTLYADTKKGRRPSFIGAAKPDDAIPMYNQFLDLLRNAYTAGQIQTGEFGADMKISLTNDGPVTISLDSN